MALRDIITGKDNNALRKRSREVTNITKRTHTLLDDMKETMHHEYGAGLAAPQVGVLRRIAIIEHENDYYEIINPVIVKKSGEALDDEGCLSVPGLRGQVKRPHSITVQYLDRNGKRNKVELEGILARIFCHEIDHLDGVLFVDKMIKQTNEDQ